MNFKLDIDAKRWREAVRKWPRTLAEAMRLALLRAMTEFREKFRESRLRGRPGLNRRSGFLFNSFQPGVTPKGTALNMVQAFVASWSPYAPIHETGGTIRPKNRKYLAVPISTWSQEAGFSGPAFGRGKAGVISGLMVGSQAGTTKPSLYGVKGLQLIKSKKGNLLLVDQAKLARGTIVPIFVLKKSVTIPPRMGFFSTFRSWVSAGGFLKHVRDAINVSWNAARAKGRV